MLHDKLKAYAESGVYPFHMPGHKRNRIGALPLELDVTEIHGFDYLHDPKGCIREAEHLAEELYRVKRAFLLVDGSTGGILAAVRAMTKPHDTVILARNCHKSVYNAAELCGLDVAYYLPAPVAGTDILGSVLPEQMEDLLTRYTPKLVVVTSPTYEGICSDIRQLAAICHRHGARLLVDEAHGAHFPFSDRFPPSAVACGADVTVTSLHKTMPAPTQTALLLTNNAELEKELQRQLAVFETSSPSYLLMCGMEESLRYAQLHSFKEYTDLLDDFYQRTQALQKLRVLRDPACFAFDFGKLVITAYHAAVTGSELASALRETYRIETEMAAAHYVIAMTSVCDSAEGFDRLFAALTELDRQIKYSDKEIKTALATVPQKRFNPSRAYLYRPETVPFDKAEGAVSLEYVYAYPPGIPLLVPGEVIDADTIKTVHALCDSGVEITSSGNHLPQFIAVADL